MSLFHLFTSFGKSTPITRVVVKTLTYAHELALNALKLSLSEPLSLGFIVAQNLVLHIYHLLSIYQVHKVVLVKILSFDLITACALRL